MSIILAILLQSASASVTPTSSEPICSDGEDAIANLTKDVQKPPTPLGFIIGTGSDWGSEFLIVKSSHHLGVPGIPTRQGATTTTYYQTAQDRVCEIHLTSKNCSTLDQAVDTIQSRSYSVAHNRSDLRSGYAYHPPYAFVHIQDGDGNVTKISATWPGHPLMSDTYELFRSIKSCTTSIEGMLDER